MTDQIQPRLGERFEHALVLAARLHAGQLRKGTAIPYISHLLSVAALVIEDGGSEDEAIAALLHDSVEDQGGAATRDLIREQFGAAVAAIVDGCSDTDIVPKPPWRERKEQHLAHLAQAGDSVRRIVAADKLHNARTVLADLRRDGPATFDRFRGGRDGSLWYYRATTTVLQAHGLSPLVDELDRVVSAIEAFAG